MNHYYSPPQYMPLTGQVMHSPEGGLCIPDGTVHMHIHLGCARGHAERMRTALSIGHQCTESHNSAARFMPGMPCPPDAPSLAGASTALSLVKGSSSSTGGDSRWASVTCTHIQTHRRTGWSDQGVSSNKRLWGTHVGIPMADGAQSKHVCCVQLESVTCVVNIPD